MGTVHVEFMCSLIDLQKPKGTEYTVTNGTLVYNARNAMTYTAIKNGFDRVLWIDSDMVFDDDTLVKLSKDMDEGLDYVSGIYFTRREPVIPTIYQDIWWKVNDDGNVDTGSKPIEELPKGLIEIAGSGFGCVMTSVDLIKAVTEKYGAPFTPMMGIGEDMAFCWRVKQLGFKMWCDGRVKVGHIGQKTFTDRDWKSLH